MGPRAARDALPRAAPSRDRTGDRGRQTWFGRSSWRCCSAHHAPVGVGARVPDHVDVCGGPGGLRRRGPGRHEELPADFLGAGRKPRGDAAHRIVPHEARRPAGGHRGRDPIDGRGTRRPVPATVDHHRQGESRACGRADDRVPGGFRRDDTGDAQSHLAGRRNRQGPRPSQRGHADPVPAAAARTRHAGRRPVGASRGRARKAGQAAVDACRCLRRSCFSSARTSMWWPRCSAGARC